MYIIVEKEDFRVLGVIDPAILSWVKVNPLFFNIIKVEASFVCTYDLVIMKEEEPIKYEIKTISYRNNGKNYYMITKHPDWMTLEEAYKKI